MTTHLRRSHGLRWLIGCTLMAVALMWGVPWTHLQEQPSAQTGLTSTTLAAALSSDGTVVNLTSGTGVAAGSRLYVDRELMNVQSAVGGSTTIWNVSRGRGGIAGGHAIGSRVYAGVAARFYNADVVGTCTAANELYTPHINPTSGQMAECEAGVWMAWSNDPIRVKENTIRDSFDQGFMGMQEDGTVESPTDAEINIVVGSPTGVVTYRNELTQTLFNWATDDGRLHLGGDDAGSADNEGAEYIFGGLVGTDGKQGRFLRTGTSGGCIAASFTVADVSATDQLKIGFRTNDEAMLDNASMVYDFIGLVGLHSNDGSIFATEIATDAEAEDVDDSGVNMADATTRAFKYCISKTGVPTAFYSDAYTTSQVLSDRPIYNAIALTSEAGTTFTADVDMVPWLTHLHTSEAVAAGIYVNWLELTRIP